MPFHNPYHFVPVLKPNVAPDADLHVTHDRYVEETASGRLVCRLETEDPIVLGHDRTGRVVNPFLRNGLPSIPASSLKGLLSSLAEAASNSAFKVLEDRQYSYRVGMNMRPLGALGMIVLESGRYKLRPLALPPLRWVKGGVQIPDEFQKMFRDPRRLKVYVDGYQNVPTNGIASLVVQDGSFLAKAPDSFSSGKRQIWHMKLDRGDLKQHKLHIKPAGNNQYVLGYKSHNPDILTDSEYRAKGQPAGYVRGILRVLGIDGRESTIPSTKKHEIFIPYPEEMEREPTFDANAAVEVFHVLADERTGKDPHLPFELSGMTRTEHGTIRLQDGDIVFFRPNPDKPSIVEEISLSSVWRRRVDGGSHDFFRQIDPEVLPFNPDRKTVSIAEQLFGYVEQRNNGQEYPKSARALAGRLRLQDAQLHPADQQFPLEPSVTLKVLDSPKPPSPSMYFKRGEKMAGDSNFIAKDELRKGRFLPQGRKFYLHRLGDDERPWVTRHPDETIDQKSIVTPLRSGLIFYFHIDFFNLSSQELGLLCYALRPTQSFRHKLGMGKALGLGRVRIDPAGLFLIERSNRYGVDDPTQAPRYHHALVEAGEALAQWPEEYREERRAAECVERQDWLDSKRKGFRASMNQTIQSALELLGDPAKVRYRVRTPQVQDGDAERETYQWFVANDKAREHGLPPLPTDDADLPTLPEMRRLNTR